MSIKIKFIKEQRLLSDTIFFTEVNSKFVEGSLSFDEEKALKAYEKIIKTISDKKIGEIILKTTII